MGKLASSRIFLGRGVRRLMEDGIYLQLVYSYPRRIGIVEKLMGMDNGWESEWYVPSIYGPIPLDRLPAEVPDDVVDPLENFCLILKRNGYRK